MFRVITSESIINNIARINSININGHEKLMLIPKEDDVISIANLAISDVDVPPTYTELPVYIKAVNGFSPITVHIIDDKEDKKNEEELGSYDIVSQALYSTYLQ